MTGEQNERLSAGIPSVSRNGEMSDAQGDAAGAFGFYLIAGVLVALAVVGLVFFLQR